MSNINRLFVAGMLTAYPLLALDLEPSLGGGYFFTDVWEAQDVAVSGNIACVAGGAGGLKVFDISDPAHPRLLGSDGASAPATKVAISGAHAFVASGEVRVIDLSDPANPRRVGGYNIRAQAVAVSGDFFYAVEGSVLHVVNISEPAHPRFAGYSYTPGHAGGVALSGNHVYLAAGDAGLDVIEVTDPANPRREGTYKLSGCAQTVTVSGNYAYVTAQPRYEASSDSNVGGGLHVIDISDPANPRQVGMYETTDAQTSVAVAGNVVYLPTWNMGVQVIDVSDPTRPERLGSYGAGNAQFSVAISGDLACVAYASALAVLDISNPEQPRLAGGYAAPLDPRDVALAGEHAYVADGVAGLEVFDISNRDEPRRIGGHFIGLPAERLALTGDRALVAADNTLHVIDISDPAKPRPLGIHRGDGLATDVAAAGNHVYLTERPRWDGANDVGGGLQVIDLSDPANPKRVGGYKTRGHANNVAVAGNYAYVADGENHPLSAQGEGLIVIDITDPANPKPVGSLPTTGDAQRVVVSGDYAYLAELSRRDDETGRELIGGFQVIDIRDPANPQRVGGYHRRYPWGFFGDMTISGNHIFVVEAGDAWSPQGGPLDLIDVSDPAKPTPISGYTGHVRCAAISGNLAWMLEVPHKGIFHGHIILGSHLQEITFNAPANPQQIGRYETTSDVRRIVISGNFAYLDVGRRLDVIEVTDPANPRPIGGSPIPGGFIRDLAISGIVACVVGENSGLLVVDITDPANPRQVGAMNTPRRVQAVAVSGGFAYLADSNEGLLIIDISDPANPRQVGRYRTTAWEVAISGSFAYVAAHQAGLLVIDISNPASPRAVGRSSEHGHADEMVVFNQHLYVARGAGLVVLDISSPARPTQIGSYETIGYENSIAVSDAFVYLVDERSGLQVLDHSDPANLRRVGGNSSFSNGRAVTIANGKVFVAAGDEGLIILHEYQPLRIEQVGREDNGVMHLRIAGPPSVPGRVQRSADLRTWTDWLPVKFGESSLEISNPDAGSVPAGFYRLALP